MMKPSLNNLLCLWCFIVEVTADWASGEVSVKQLGANSSAIDGIELEKGILNIQIYVHKTLALKIMEVNNL